MSSTTLLRNLSKNTLKKNHLGLLTETHEVLLRLIKTPNIHVQDGGTHRRPFPPDHIVDLEEAAMGWVRRLVSDSNDCMIFDVYWLSKQTNG